MTRVELVRQADGDDGLGRPSPAGASGALGMGGGGSAPHEQHKNLLRVVWRGRWIVLLCAAAGVAAGFFYLSKQTPIYASTSRVLVEPDSPIMAGDLAGRAQSSNFFQTQCELIKSATILSSVAELPELRAMRTFDGVDNPIGLLRANVTAEAGQKDDLIAVTFESPYPTEAAVVVDAVVDSYKRYHAGRKKSSAGEVLRILAAEKRDRDKDLREQTKKVLAFKQAHPQLSYANEKGNIIVEQLVKLSDALTTARLEALEAKRAADSAEAMAGNPARMEQWLRLQQGPTAGGPLVADIQRLELELAGAQQALGTSHATVKGLQTRLEALREKNAEQAREALDAYLAAVDQRRLAADQREAQLRESFDQQQKAALALNTDETEFAMLKAEAQRLEKHCDLLDSRIKEVRINEHADAANNITVLERARAAAAPVRPKRGTVLFEALMLGLAAGCGLAYLRDWMDQRLASADEIQARLGLGVLGVLPHMAGNETAAVRGQKVELDPMSDVAEAYRTIRTAVYFGAPEGKTKTILVTSPAPGDGKTTTASNLAIAMAQAGQRVLLIDCDFRRPTQHRIFDVTDGLGLSNVLAAQVPLSKVVKPTPTRGLYLLPAGPVPRNPSEILNGQAFAQLLSRMREKFDHIVIDSPPVMPVTDARILGASCDLTILVLRARKSTRRLSAQACDSLIGVGSQILGVVVNDAPRRRNGYGAYGYGYDRYGYGYGNGNGKAAAANGLEGRTNGARLPAAIGPAANAASE